MELITGRFTFPSGGRERSLSNRFISISLIKESYIALSGYNLSYIGEEHQIREITVRLEIQRQNVEVFGEGPYNFVDFSAIVNLRDDDLRYYEGFVDYVLFIEFERRRIEQGLEINEIIVR